MILGLTIIAIGLFNGLMLSFVLLQKKMPNPFLGLFILTHCIVLVGSSHNFLPIGEQPSFLWYAAELIGWTIAPFLYFYAKSYHNKSFTLPIHFLPVFIWLIGGLVYPELSEADEPHNTILTSGRVIQGLIYLMVLFRDIKNDKWLSMIAFLFLIESMVTFVAYNLSRDAYFTQLLSPLSNILVIAFITYTSIKNTRFITDSLNRKKRFKDQLVQQKAFEEIRRHMIDSELYLNPNIKLADLANELKLPVKQISQAINESTGENFNLFINRYRIKAAERLLIEQSHNITIDAIAELSGFSNKVSFYKAFKKVHDISPKEYIEVKTIHP